MRTIYDALFEIMDYADRNGKKIADAPQYYGEIKTLDSMDIAFFGMNTWMLEMADSVLSRKDRKFDSGLANSTLLGNLVERLGLKYLEYKRAKAETNPKGF